MAGCGGTGAAYETPEKMAAAASAPLGTGAPPDFGVWLASVDPTKAADKPFLDKMQKFFLTIALQTPSDLDGCGEQAVRDAASKEGLAVGESAFAVKAVWLATAAGNAARRKIHQSPPPAMSVAPPPAGLATLGGMDLSRLNVLAGDASAADVAQLVMTGAIDVDVTRVTRDIGMELEVTVVTWCGVALALAADHPCCAVSA